MEEHTEEPITFPKFVGRSLYDLAYFKQYPLNPGVTKRCFLDTIKWMGAEVVYDDEFKETSIVTVANLNKNKRMKPRYSEILGVFEYRELGKSFNYPENSLRAFEELVEILWQPGGKISENEARIFGETGKEMTKLFKDAMEIFLLPSLIRYQEHMLIPASGEVPRLDRPRIAPYIISMNRKNVEPGINFWAKYLDRLAKVKGYPLNESFESDEERLEELVEKGNFALQDGRDIWKVAY